jgi:hypothetical protein
LPTAQTELQLEPRVEAGEIRRRALDERRAAAAAPLEPMPDSDDDEMS